MNIFKYLIFSAVLTVISLTTVFFFPTSVVTDLSDPVSSPYFDMIQQLNDKDSITEKELADLKNLIDKNNEWFENRRENAADWNTKNSIDEYSKDTVFSFYVKEKSKDFAIFLLMVWALASYLFLLNKSLRYSPLLLFFPILILFLGYIHTVTVLALIIGVCISVVTIKFINPLIGSIGTKK